MKHPTSSSIDLSLAPTQQELEAREYFPRGLSQPVGSFRFSADALLLAEFAAGKTARPLRGLDLGCGCGVVGLGLMLRLPALRCTGVDISPELIAAATQNAGRLGLSEHYRAVVGDVRDYRSIAELKPGAFDLAVANPPYREVNSGRLSPSGLRLAALFETHGDMADFAAAAAYALKNNGRFCCVYDARRLFELCAALAAQGLTPKRIRPVHGRSGEGARLILLEARRGGKPGLKWDPPLYLGKSEQPDNLA